MQPLLYWPAERPTTLPYDAESQLIFCGAFYSIVAECTAIANQKTFPRCPMNSMKNEQEKYETLAADQYYRAYYNTETPAQTWKKVKLMSRRWAIF